MKAFSLAIAVFAVTTACNNAGTTSSVKYAASQRPFAAQSALASALTGCVQESTSHHGRIPVIGQAVVAPACADKIEDQTSNDGETLLIRAADQTYKVVGIGPEGTDNDEWNIKITDAAGETVYRADQYVSDDSLLGAVAQIVGVQIEQIDQ